MSIKKTKLRKTLDQMKAKGLDREAIVEKIYPKSVKGVSIPAGKKFSKRIESLLPKK